MPLSFTLPDSMALMEAGAAVWKNNVAGREEALGRCLAWIRRPLINRLFQTLKMMGAIHCMQCHVAYAIK